MRPLFQTFGVSASTATRIPTRTITTTCFHGTKTLTSSLNSLSRLPVHHHHPPLLRSVYQHGHHLHQARNSRTFFTDPEPRSRACQAISASRTLPYRAGALYRLISDIDSYASFLPYVLESTVLTRHPLTGAPLMADLRIGFPPFDETFRSTVTCTEPSLVEATSSPSSPVFDALRTRWEIRPTIPPPSSPSPLPATVVDLRIEVGFKSRMHEVLAQAVISKVAREMIDAFEKRAREVLETQNGGVVGECEKEEDGQGGLQRRESE